MKPWPRPLAGGADWNSAMTRSEQLYSNIRDDILSLTLRPGERVSERMIEARYGDASRTPIRSALSRLATDRLVHQVEGGWAVTPLSVTHIMQAGEFRVGLEREGIRLVCERASNADLDYVARYLIPQRPDVDRPEWLRTSWQFHVELVRLSGNDLYAEAMADVMQRLARVRWLEISDDTGRMRTIVEHREILNHIRQRDIVAAQAAVTTHAMETTRRHQATLAAAAVSSGAAIIGEYS